MPCFKMVPGARGLTELAVISTLSSQRHDVFIVWRPGTTAFI